MAQVLECAGGVLDRGLEVRPMHLIEIDDVGAKPLQRVLDLLENSLRPGIAEGLSVPPGQSDLGGDLHLLAQTALGERLADYFFGTAEAIDRGSIDQRHAALDGRTDRGDRLGFIRTAPHPTADRPGAEADPRGVQAGGADGYLFHASPLR